MSPDHIDKLLRKSGAPHCRRPGQRLNRSFVICLRVNQVQRHTNIRVGECSHVAIGMFHLAHVHSEQLNKEDLSEVINYDSLSGV